MFDAPEGLKGYVGEEDGFDPLRLSDAFDMVRRAPPTQLTRDAMLGVSAVLVPCVAVAGLCRLSDPPEAVGLSACIAGNPGSSAAVRGGGWLGRACAASTGRNGA